MTLDLALGLPSQRWSHVARNDSRCRELVDGVGGGASTPHYSRESVGAVDFMGSGKTFVLLAEHEGGSRAVWGVIENFDGSRDGTRRFRCSIYRNETPWLSSELIREATALTYERWARAFQWSGSPPLITEVDASKVKRKRDPGRCFLKAGWTRTGEITTRGRLIFRAPPPCG